MVLDGVPPGFFRPRLGRARLRVVSRDGFRQSPGVPIHPTAIIHPSARVAADVEIGPLAVIDAGVELGAGCRVGPYVHLTGCSIIGARNAFGTGCVIGGPPQDLRFAGGPTRVRIGDDNVFREHVTVHCANRLDEDTVIGSGNLLMTHAHVGHNSRIGNQTIIANGALLGGHVVVADRAFVSGNCLVHQFVRVGTLAMMQGGSAISQDLPPYCISRGDNGLSGLNVIGLRRAGVDAETRLELRRLYHALFRLGLRRAAAVQAAEALARSDWGRTLVEFVRSSRRGIVAERSRRGGGRDEE